MSLNSSLEVKGLRCILSRSFDLLSVFRNHHRIEFISSSVVFRASGKHSTPKVSTDPHVQSNFMQNTWRSAKKMREKWTSLPSQADVMLPQKSMRKQSTAKQGSLEGTSPGRPTSFWNSKTSCGFTATPNQLRVFRS